VLILGACRQEANKPIAAQSDEADNSGVQGREEDREYLVPWLSNAGPAIVFLRVASPHAEWAVMSHERGVPFGSERPDDMPPDVEPLRPSPPAIAIWRNGVIIWSPDTKVVAREYYEATIVNNARRTWRAAVEKRGAQDEEDSIVTPGLRERKKPRPGLGQAGHNDYFFGDDWSVSGDCTAFSAAVSDEVGVDSVVPSTDL